jgi:hypothetical protein
MLSRRDIRALLQSLHDVASQGGCSLVFDTDSLYYKQIGGGYSGAFVALIWMDGSPTFIFKAGDSAAIHAEINARLTFDSPALSAIRALHLDVCSEEVDVEIDGREEPWRAMLYGYVGGLTHAEIEHYGDFEKVFRDYLDGTAQAPGDAILEAWLDDLFRAVRQREDTTSSSVAGARSKPLVAYIPPLRWDQGLSALLETAALSSPHGSEIANFRSWWDDRIGSVNIAGYPSAALVHGDLRFANVLINRRTADVELIDFGGVRRGHVFQDLARFECDLLCGIEPAKSGTEQSPAGDADWILEVAFNEHGTALARPAADLEPWLRALKILRSTYDKYWRLAGDVGRRRMYTWFLLNEVLRRLLWAGGVSEDRRRRLLTSVVMLKRVIDDQGASATGFSAVADISRILSVTRVYVPVQGKQRKVNSERNGAKIDALQRAAASGGDVKLLAETGHSFFFFRGAFREQVEAVARRGSFKAVIANPVFIEAQGISAAYKDREPSAAQRINPLLANKFSESIRGYQQLHDQYPENIDLKITNYGVGITVLLTDDRIFLEPYLRSDRTRRHEQLFDTFELEFDGANNHVRRVVEEHFEFHHSNGVTITDFETSKGEYQKILNDILSLRSYE